MVRASLCQLIVSEMLVVLVMPPPDPVMVMVRVPVEAVREALMVMVEAPDPVMDVGLKDMVTPLPAPDADRLMLELNPPVAVVVTVTEPEDFLATLTEVGEAEMLKLADVLVMVSETVVDSFTPPPLPLMLML